MRPLTLVGVEMRADQLRDWLQKGPLFLVVEHDGFRWEFTFTPLDSAQQFGKPQGVPAGGVVVAAIGHSRLARLVWVEGTQLFVWPRGDNDIVHPYYAGEKFGAKDADAELLGRVITAVLCGHPLPSHGPDWAGSDEEFVEDAFEESSAFPEGGMR